jgi:hypothetical protein
MSTFSSLPSSISSSIGIPPKKYLVTLYGINVENENERTALKPNPFDYADYTPEF